MSDHLSQRYNKYDYRRNRLSQNVTEKLIPVTGYLAEGTINTNNESRAIQINK